MSPRAGGHGLICGVWSASLTGGGCRRLWKIPQSPCLEHVASVPMGPSGVGRAPWAPALTAPLSPTACTRCSSRSSRRPTTSGTTGPPRATASERACCVHREHHGPQGSLEHAPHLCLFFLITIPVPPPLPIPDVLYLPCLCAVLSAPRASAGLCPQDPQTHCSLCASNQSRAHALPPRVSVVAPSPECSQVAPYCPMQLARLLLSCALCPFLVWEVVGGSQCVCALGGQAPSRILVHGGHGSGTATLLPVQARFRAGASARGHTRPPPSPALPALPTASSSASARRCPSWRTHSCASWLLGCPGSSLWGPRMPWSLPTTW